jgi:hypothetical protein
MSHLTRLYESAELPGGGSGVRSDQAHHSFVTQPRQRRPVPRVQDGEPALVTLADLREPTESTSARVATGSAESSATPTSAGERPRAVNTPNSARWRSWALTAQVPKLRVAGSNPVARFLLSPSLTTRTATVNRWPFGC